MCEFDSSVVNGESNACLLLCLPLLSLPETNNTSCSKATISRRQPATTSRSSSSGNSSTHRPSSVPFQSYAAVSCCAPRAVPLPLAPPLQRAW